ncbi:hypothetical protein Hanom_Chr15g01344381 [Helianthus anomalus]
MWTKCLQSARRRGFVFFPAKSSSHTTHTRSISLCLLSLSTLSLQSVTTTAHSTTTNEPKPPPSHHRRRREQHQQHHRRTSTAVAMNNINSTIVLSVAVNKEVVGPSPRRFLSF